MDLTKPLFGKCFIGMTLRGICHLSFTDSIGTLKNERPQAQLKEDKQKAKAIIQNIFEDRSSTEPFHLFVKGTDFQVKVWQALVSIPKGITTSYENIAHIVGNPKAVRAVANAVANNPIASMSPCY